MNTNRRITLSLIRPTGYALGHPSTRCRERPLFGPTLPAEFDPLRMFPQSAIERMTRAGFPPTRVFGGTSLVTTEPAATTDFSPTVTPPMMVAPAAVQTFLSITMGFAISKSYRWEGSTGGQ